MPLLLELVHLLMLHEFSGYGATTFPSLTEAFTIEHNRTLAINEARRLEALINKLTKVIRP